MVSRIDFSSNLKIKLKINWFISQRVWVSYSGFVLTKQTFNVLFIDYSWYIYISMILLEMSMVIVCNICIPNTLIAEEWRQTDIFPIFSCPLWVIMYPVWSQIPGCQERSLICCCSWGPFPQVLVCCLFWDAFFAHRGCKEWLFKSRWDSCPLKQVHSSLSFLFKVFPPG